MPKRATKMTKKKSSYSQQMTTMVSQKKTRTRLEE